MRMPGSRGSSRRAVKPSSLVEGVPQRRQHLVHRAALAQGERSGREAVTTKSRHRAEENFGFHGSWSEIYSTGV